MHYFIIYMSKILICLLDKSQIMSYTKYVIAKLKNTVRDNGFGHGKISFQEKGSAA